MPAQAGTKCAAMPSSPCCWYSWPNLVLTGLGLLMPGPAQRVAEAQASSRGAQPEGQRATRSSPTLACGVVLRRGDAGGRPCSRPGNCAPGLKLGQRDQEVNNGYKT